MRALKQRSHLISQLSILDRIACLESQNKHLRNERDLRQGDVEHLQHRLEEAGLRAGKLQSHNAKLQHQLTMLLKIADEALLARERQLAPEQKIELISAKLQEDKAKSNPEVVKHEARNLATKLKLAKVRVLFTECPCMSSV